MTPNELFARMPAATAGDLFAHVLEKEKPLYKATIETLSRQRNLRPVFVERKPRPERHAWLKDALSRKQNEGVAAHLLQIWLVGEHSKVLCDFLDGLGVAHDDNGTVEQLPPPPPRAKLEPVIDTLFKKHDADVVRVYLHAFQALDEKGWPALGELLESDERLRFSETAASV
ncbi:MAG: hypothetical protein QOD99_2061 [Chthoniobacter sp.]|jgi:hypothetical protein|nr:hypothetical protein [Chthoniobacter sp.]